MPKRIKLYHGSDKIVEHPELGKGSARNDYGQGFYCTMHYELACEWASKNEAVNGYANEYELDLSSLKVLDLSDPAYNILNWITLLIQNRTFTSTAPISKQAQAYLIENFSIDVSDYDVVKGYRADDSYFSFAKDFVNNTISVQQLAKAMKLGKLGIQYMLRTEKAFANLTYVGAQEVDWTIYHAKYLKRDFKARSDYSKSRADLTIDSNELYVLDMIRGGIKHGDPRL